MPCGSYFTFNVQIDGKYLSEHELHDKEYVCVNLHGSQSYYVEEAEREEEGSQEQQFQKYPVTPFKLAITKEYDYPCWFTIYMDGERVASFPMAKQGRCTRVQDGYKSGNEIRELAFSLPRISNARTLTKSRQEHAGTLEVICQEAIPRHVETVPVPQHVDRNSLPETTSYPQLTKRDVSAVQGGMGVVCREGRTFKELNYDKCTFRQRVKLERGSMLESLTLHYRSKEVLKDLGVVFESQEDDMTNKLQNVNLNSSPKNGRQHNGVLPDLVPANDLKCEQSEMENEMLDNDQHLRMSKNNTTPAKGCQKFECMTPLVDYPYSPVAQKHEQIKMEADREHLIELKSELFEGSDDDDDVVYIETTYMKREPGDLDDSVIYMGDDSCCEIELPEEEISVLDLCGDDE